MKKSINNMKKKVILSLLLVLVSFSFVAAIGVTHPQPQNIQLKPGESSYFALQVQSDNFALKCVPVVEDSKGLELAFSPEYNIEPNMQYNIKPQVVVPKKTAYGSYKALFCMECSPAEDVEGSKIIPRICNLPITVDVVSERTGANMFDQKAAGLAIWVVVLVSLSVAILVLSTVIYYLVRRRRMRAIA